MSTNVKTQVQIRWLVTVFHPDVMVISDHSMPTPYTADHLKNELRRRNCSGMVATIGDRALGFMIYMIEKHEIHLEEIAVHQAFRSRGIGSQMIDHLISKLSSRRPKITLYCRELNLRAQQFYRSQGFIATNVLRGYYNDTNEDAYFFEYKLPSESK